MTNKVVHKDKKHGCVLRIFRRLSSTNTKAEKLHMFERLVSILKINGLQDPFICSTHMTMSFSTDFGTTYWAAFATAMAKLYQQDQDLADYARCYVHMFCFGCGVQAKSAILNKLDITVERYLYNWAVGTWTVLTVQERWACLSEMTAMGGRGGLQFFFGYNKTMF